MRVTSGSRDPFAPQLAVSGVVCASSLSLRVIGLLLVVVLLISGGGPPV